MTNFLLLVAVVTLFYIAWKIPKDPERQKEVEDVASKKASMFARQLPTLKGKACEFTMGTMAAAFDYNMTGKGVVVDSDDEWVLVACDTRKGPIEKMFRISQISELRELR